MKLELDIKHTRTLSAKVACTALLTLCLMVAPVNSAGAGEAIQSDWSAGPTFAQAVTSWTSSFASSDNISWLDQDGRIVLSSTTANGAEKLMIDEDGGHTAGLAVGDIDDDGRLDVIGAVIDSNRVAWWRNVGDGEWMLNIVDDDIVRPATVKSADFDNDGDLDILAGALQGDEVVWYENLETAWDRHVISDQVRGVHWVTTTDLDDDGDDDVIAAGMNSNEIVLWLNALDESAGWISQVVEADFPGARHVEAGDIDGDGDIDLVGAALESNSVVWWEQQEGDPLLWAPHRVADDFGLSHGVRIADLDRDGDLDIVGAGYTAPFLKWWRNDGASDDNWSELNFGSIFTGGLVVDVADFDGDNDLDVVATSDRWGQVHWWENLEGDSLTWTNHILASGIPNAWPVVAADFDNNGRPDVVAAGNGGNEIAWFDLGEFVTEGQLTSQILEIPSGMRGLVASVEAALPDLTDVSLEIRIAEAGTEDTIADAPWVETHNGSFIPITTEPGAQVQYRVRLKTLDPTVSPVVSAISFSWYDAGDIRAPRRGNRRSP